MAREAARSRTTDRLLVHVPSVRRDKASLKLWRCGKRFRVAGRAAQGTRIAKESRNVRFTPCPTGCGAGLQRTREVRIRTIVDNHNSADSIRHCGSACLRDGGCPAPEAIDDLEPGTASLCPSSRARARRRQAGRDAIPGVPIDSIPAQAAARSARAAGAHVGRCGPADPGGIGSQGERLGCRRDRPLRIRVDRCEAPLPRCPDRLRGELDADRPDRRDRRPAQSPLDRCPGPSGQPGHRARRRKLRAVRRRYRRCRVGLRVPAHRSRAGRDPDTGRGGHGATRSGDRDRRVPLRSPGRRTVLLRHEVRIRLERAVAPRRSLRRSAVHEQHHDRRRCRHARQPRDLHAAGRRSAHPDDADRL